MDRPTSSVITPTKGQPQVISAGPPVFIPVPYRVRHPDRIEMIVNETAKLEKPDMCRRSSCAYPISCRRFSSALIVAAVAGAAGAPGTPALAVLGGMAVSSAGTGPPQ